MIITKTGYERLTFTRTNRFDKQETNLSIRRCADFKIGFIESLKNEYKFVLKHSDKNNLGSLFI